MYLTYCVNSRKICLSDIINGFNALPEEQWKCDMILELTDCKYGFSNSSLHYEKAKYCPWHIASD